MVADTAESSMDHLVIFVSKIANDFRIGGAHVCNTITSLGVILVRDTYQLLYYYTTIAVTTSVVADITVTAAVTTTTTSPAPPRNWHH